MHVGRHRPGWGLGVLAFALACGGPKAPPSAPLQESPTLTDTVDAVFADLDRADSPGCAVGVIQDGALVHGKGYGMADLATSEPITLQTAFAIESTSKQFTAAAIALLAQQGRLDVRDPIARYLPELGVADRGITLQQLLHHTSGVRDYLDLMLLAGTVGIDDPDGPRVNTEQALALITKQRGLGFEPGSRFAYSNSNYVLLGEVVLRVSGSSLPDFAQTNIFAPLRMHDTRFGWGGDKGQPGARGYRRNEDGTGVRAAGPTIEVAADGGVVTTVSDLARWDANFYGNQLGNQLGNQPGTGGAGLIDTMLTVGTLVDRSEVDYAYGLQVEPLDDGADGAMVVSHAGGSDGFSAELVRVPTERLSVICLCNLGVAQAARRARDVLAIYRGTATAEAERTKPKPSVSVSREVLHRYVGRYHVEGVSFEIERRGDALWVVGDGEPLELVATSSDTFVFDDVEVSFSTLGGETARSMLVRTPEGVEIPARRCVPTASAEFVGRYHSDELDADWALRSEDGGLRLRIGQRAPLPVDDCGGGTWTFGWGTFEVRRDQDGTVTALVAHSGGARGVVFERTASFRSDAPKGPAERRALTRP